MSQKYKTLITFVHFKRSDDSIYEENLYFFIELGLIDSSEYHFNFIINSEKGGEFIPKRKNISVIKGHNKGYDFGAYKQSLDSVNLQDFNRFIFMNDTCRGPFIPNYVPKSINWVEMFLHEMDDKVKLVGATWFNAEYDEFLQDVLKRPKGTNTHIQSWCFGMDKTALKILLKNKIFDTIGKDKWSLITEHEIKMSQILINSGYIVKPFQLSREIEKHQDVNHNDAYFKINLNPLEVMFFKVKSSGKGQLINPQVLKNYTKWKLRPIPAKHKIAIVLHVYYVDLWNFFKEKLDNLNIDFDLYITLCEEVKTVNFLSHTISNSFPSAKIFKFPNKGQDIGPFLQVFKEIRNKDYDFLIKLHTKKSKYDLPLGKKWRESLVNNLINSDSIIKKNIAFLQNSDFKMCGSEDWLIDSNIEVSRKRFLNGDYYEFIGGTMFMVDFQVYKQFLTDKMIDTWYKKMPKGYVKDYSFAHDVERLLGKIIIDSGYKIKGLDHDKP